MMTYVCKMIVNYNAHKKWAPYSSHLMLNYVVFLSASSVEDLKSKFCSTVANDIMLVSTLGVIRMWADEASRKSRFRILFTTYQERKAHCTRTVYRKDVYWNMIHLMKHSY